MNKKIKRILISPISIRLLSVMIGFVTAVIINRSLGLELRGTYTTIYTYSILFQSILNFGLAFAYAPLIKKYGKKCAKEGLCSIIVLQSIFYFIVALVVFAISRDNSLRFIAILTLMYIVNGQVMFMSLIEDIRARNFILLISAIIYMLANIIIMVFLPNNLNIVLICIAIKLSFEIVVFFYYQKLFVFDNKLIFRVFVVDVFKFGIPTAILAFLIQFNYNIDVVIMNFLHIENIEIGIFGIAYSLSNMLWFIPDAFKELIYHDSAHERIEKKTLGLIVINSIICLFICISFIVYGKIFLEILYGNEFKSAYLSTLTVFIGIIPMVAFKLIHPIYVNDGRPFIVIKILIISIVVNSIAGFALIPMFGAFGAALSTVISYSVCGILFVFKFMRDYNLKLSDFKSGLLMLRRLS